MWFYAPISASEFEIIIGLSADFFLWAGVLFLGFPVLLSWYVPSEWLVSEPVIMGWVKGKRVGEENLCTMLEMESERWVGFYCTYKQICCLGAVPVTLRLDSKRVDQLHVEGWTSG